MEVVVVLPWLPAMAMPYFRRISSASSSPRGITGICRRRASCTSGFCASTAELTTSALRAGDVRGGVAFVDAWRPARPAARWSGVSFRSEPLIVITQIEQHLGDAAHADSADSGEVQVLGLKKHFIIVLFRLSAQLSIENRSYAAPPPPERPPRAARRPGCANCRAASPMRSSASGSAASSRTSLEQPRAGPFPRPAPGGPRRRARTLRRCAADDRRRRRETAPGSTACRPPPVRPPRPRPARQTTRSAAANAAGMSSMNGTHLALQPDSRELRAQSPRTPPCPV